MSNVKSVTEFRRKRKKALADLFYGKCSLCGYDRTYAALEFHHINPSEKKYSISADGICHCIEEDISEAKKCLLVCANCHREIHAGMYSQIDLFCYQKINSDKEKELIFSSSVVNKYYCSECGTEILKNKNGLCKECYNVSKRKVERPDRETLKSLIRNVPFSVIGEQYYGVTDNAVRKWCISMHLPHKKVDIDAFSDEEWMLI